MASNLSCLIVIGGEFPEQKLTDLLAPELIIDEFDYASSPSEAFQFLLNSNFNLCLIGARYQAEMEPFFRDMQKLGRDKTCAFVKVLPTPSTPEKRPSHSGSGFCATITLELSEEDIKELRRALSKEVVRIFEEQRGDDIPAYVDMALKQVDEAARKKQRGMHFVYDKVVASLIRDVMREGSSHSEKFIDTLSARAEKSESFQVSAVEMPSNVLERNLPKLDKTKYVGKSSRVWKNLLKRYGNQKAD